MTYIKIAVSTLWVLSLVACGGGGGVASPVQQPVNEPQPGGVDASGSGVSSDKQTPVSLIMTATVGNINGVYLSDGTDAGSGFVPMIGYNATDLIFVKPNTSKSAYFYSNSSSWTYFGNGSGASTSFVGYTDGTLSKTYSLLKDGSEYTPINYVATTGNKLILAGHSSSGSLNGKSVLLDGINKTVTTKLLDYAVLPNNDGGINDGDQGVWFGVNTAPYGNELVRFNNDSQVTQLVKDIAPGSASGYLGGGARLPNGKLIFGANDNVNGQELWVSDGTANGTKMLEKFGGNNAGSWGQPRNFTNLGNIIIFQAFVYRWLNNGQTTAAGWELLSTDGSTGGTKLLEVNPGDNQSSPNNANPKILGVKNGYLYFIASVTSGEINSKSIFKTDGMTVEKLVDLKTSILTRNDYPALISMPYLLQWNENCAYFINHDENNGDELWVANFFDGSFSIVRDIFLGSGSALADGNTNSILVKNKIIFTASTSINKLELYISDGSSMGTRKIASSKPEYSAIVGDFYIYSTGQNLYAIDTSSVDSSPILVSANLDVASSPQNDANSIYFKTIDNKLQKYLPVAKSSVTLSLEVVQFSIPMDSTIFFIKNIANTTNKSLWFSDGNSAGTRLIKILPTGNFKMTSSTVIAR